MRVRQLEIKGFRNLSAVKLDFDPSASLFTFVGKNGQGKTNLLEALYIASLSKSFRTSKNEDLIGFEDDFCRITALCHPRESDSLSSSDLIRGSMPKSIDSRFHGNDIEDRGNDISLEVIVTRTPLEKALKVNGVRKAATDFIGHLPLVFFSPDDISELEFSPSSRRRYLNVMLSQLDRAYLDTLLRYNHLLQQRNALLRQIRDGKAKEGELAPWDEQLMVLGITLITKRATLIESLYPLVHRFYKAFSGGADELNLGYVASAEAERLGEKLAAHHARDIATGVTNLGPHRDDLKFLFNEHDMRSFASRGEWRSLVLALKLAEKEWLKKKLEKDPLLLLDDVFSELDEERQKYLMEHLGNSQTFLTTTHAEFLEQIKMKKVIYEVEEGRVI